MAIIDLKQQFSDMMRHYATLWHRPIQNTITEEFYDSSITYNSFDLTNQTIEMNPTMVAFDSTSVNNNTSLSQTPVRRLKTVHTETVATAVTDGYKVGGSSKTTFSGKISLKIPAGPGVEAGMSQEFAISGEYNHSTTQTTTVSNSKEWAIDVPIATPPFKKITATLVVMGGPVSVPFKFRSTVKGKGPNNFLGGINFTDERGWPVSSQYDASMLYNLNWPTKQPVYEQSDENSAVMVKGSGNLEINKGYYSYIRYKEEPCEDAINYSYSNSNETAPSKVYYSDITFADGTIIPASQAMHLIKY